ncbi:hypothetical protein [Kribbella sp. C-35]|uniref:hypothetical protein n=1 Tax=Kribbella sp. C-35 TaxID=2789276 RepID=UPI00397CE529
MSTPDDRRDVALDDDRTLDNDDVEADPDLAGHHTPDTTHTTETTDTADTAGTASTAEPAGSAGTAGTASTAEPAESAGTAGTTADEPLVAEDSAVDYRTRWEVVQQGFVDDPRNAVSEADKLVDDVLKHLADGFDRQHRDLEQQWSDGEPSTEDLRSALQRYRAFFQRLLTL